MKFYQRTIIMFLSILLISFAMLQCRKDRILDPDSDNQQSAAASSSSASSAFPEILIDDFTDGDLNANAGWGNWRAMNGAAVVTNVIVSGYSGNSIQYPFAPAAYNQIWSENPVRSLTAIGATHLSFYIRATGIFSNTKICISSSHAASNGWKRYLKDLGTLSSNWTLVTLNLYSDFTASSPGYTLAEAMETCNGFLWAGNAGGIGTVELDNVKLICGVVPSSSSSSVSSASSSSSSSASSLSLPSSISYSTNKSFEVMTWLPKYSVSVWKSALEMNTGGAFNPRNTLSIVAGQFFTVRSNGSLVQEVSDADLQWVIDYCHANGIKFLTCIYNANSATSSWDWITSSYACEFNRTALISNIIYQVNRCGAAGVDIDFEGYVNIDATVYDYKMPQFTNFLQELKTALHGIGKILTVDVLAGPWWQCNTDQWDMIAPHVDFLNSMGYEYIFGGAPATSSYRYQQDNALAAGLTNYQFNMGLPSHTNSWGSNGMGSNTIDHLNELISSNYNRLPTSVCIWDGRFMASSWQSAAVWSALHQIRTTPVE